jgi:hypothetical protein
MVGLLVVDWRGRFPARPGRPVVVVTSGTASAPTQQPGREHGGHEHDQGAEEGDNGQGNGPDAVS